ncbi:MAG: hypothetical protein NBV67_15790 [Tagaea sp.]|nr:hypothetical protein [Tagaea sp.]
MPALNFQKRFVPLIESGAKPHTFRVEGKRRPPRVGETLSLYYGMRTKACRLIKRVPCAAVQRMSVKFLNTPVGWYAERTIDGVPMTGAQNEAFAVADGFESWPAFEAWLRTAHEAPEDGIVRGWLIWWGPSYGQ